MDNKLVTLLEKMYGKSRSAVRLGKDLGEWFRTTLETSQGDPVSPLWFITYLESIIYNTTAKYNGDNIGGIFVLTVSIDEQIKIKNEKAKTSMNSNNYTV